MEDHKTKQTSKQISSPIHRSISTSISPEVLNHLWLWPHPQNDMVQRFSVMTCTQLMEYIDDLP